MFLPNRLELQSEEIRGGGWDLKTETHCQMRYSKRKYNMPGDTASRTGPLITHLIKRNLWFLWKFTVVWQPQWLPLIPVCFTVGFLHILLFCWGKSGLKWTFPIRQQIRGTAVKHASGSVQTQPHCTPPPPMLETWRPLLRQAKSVGAMCGGASVAYRAQHLIWDFLRSVWAPLLENWDHPRWF